MHSSYLKTTGKIAGKTTGMAATIGMAVLLTACAGGEFTKPTNQLAETREAINQAEGADARQYVPLLLSEAQDKLISAREAVDTEKYKEATYLLEKAEQDARYARAQAMTAETAAALEELQNNIRALRARIAREQG